MVDVNRIVYYVLLIGMASSMTLFLIGLGLAFQAGIDISSVQPETYNLPALIEGLRKLDASAILFLATSVSIATPVMRVIASLAAFLWNRDLRFALITSTVLLVILAGIAVGLSMQ